MIAGIASWVLIFAGAAVIGIEVAAGRPLGALLGLCTVCLGVVLACLWDRYR